MTFDPVFPPAPNGLLFVATDVDPADESDFNRWYDREHIEERVRIPGFLEGARYVSVQGGRKYLGLYRTQSLAAFTTAAYRAAFERQTAWSVTNLDRMRDPIRRVCAVEAVTGMGAGSQLVVQPLPASCAGAPLARARNAGAELQVVEGFVRSFLLVPDAALSTPLPRESTEGRTLAPMFVVEASTRAAAQMLQAGAAAAFDADPASAWLYELGWKLDASALS